MLIRKAKGSEKRRGQGFKDSRGQKRKGSRIQGFKGSSGSLGIFFQNLKAKELRGEGLPNQRNQRVD